jgi:hypothetical protein
MAKNTYKQEPSPAAPPKPKAKDKTTFWVRLNESIDIEKKVDSLPMQYRYYAIWIFFLLFIMISFNHQYENQVRDIDRLKKKIEQKRAEYIFKSSRFVHNTKKSQLGQQLASQGLVENTKAPIKLKMED